MMMVMTAVAIFSVVDVLSKYLTRSYPVALVVWARYAFHLLLVVVVLGPRYGLALVRTARPGAQILRGLSLTLASILFISALKYMPLAESTAIAFVAPLVVTLMSVLLLKEKVELARWVAVCCGFVGVLIIIRPGSNVFSWAVLLPLGNIGRSHVSAFRPMVPAAEVTELIRHALQATPTSGRQTTGPGG